MANTIRYVLRSLGFSGSSNRSAIVSSEERGSTNGSSSFEILPPNSPDLYVEPTDFVTYNGDHVLYNGEQVVYTG